ncbi:hypothetical protein [Labrys monachus]|uniref:Uncharacterized protein n=1 Tax=Labrys monachus TaxID=217067 RepID=A0ABU0FMK6_9HYPH|nr:hypothetical protein [Labrys monachus]MDQ0395848.1 hypothetical protein [Labrys monachus]
MTNAGSQEPAAAASDHMRLLHHAESGDDWLLVRSRDGVVEVEHRPNAPSGGKVSRIGIGAFLQADPRGPQHDELLRLLGTLVDIAPAGAETS